MQLAYFFVGCVTLREYLNVAMRLVASRTNHRLWHAALVLLALSLLSTVHGKVIDRRERQLLSVNCQLLNDRFFGYS